MRCSFTISSTGKNVLKTFSTLFSCTLFLTALLVYSKANADDYTQWNYWSYVTVNTTPSGANVPGNVQKFPVLVRLTGSNFNFGEAKTGGADIRFSKTDSTKHLYYQIERWNSTGSLAEIWVLVDTVYGNNATQKIKMYWGKSDAADSSKPEQVFSTGNNFAAVWHLSNSNYSDATSNNNDGSNYGSIDSAGTVANGRFFDGVNDYIQVGASTASVGITDLNTFTVSAWIKPKGWGGLNYGRILDKTDTLYDGLTFFTANGGGANGVCAIALLRDRATTDTDVRSADSTIKLNQWQYVTGVMNGITSTKLYIDSTEASYKTQILGSGSLITENTYTLAIGNRDWDSARSFDGTIDEIRIENTPRSADWIKLNYHTQRAGQASVLAQPVNIPKITSQPVADTANQGTAASFTVAASGTPAPTYQWQKKQGAGSWTNVSGATGSTYSIPSAAFPDTGVYRAVATNTWGVAVSSQARLVVLAGSWPVFTLHPKADTAKVTQSAFFNASATGTPAPTYQWQKKQGAGAWGTITGATDTFYTISSVQLSDSGNYQVIATNANGADTSNPTFLFVYDTFSITAHPVHDTAILGATAGFSVTATGATTTYQWQKRIGTGGTPANITGATSAAYSFTVAAGDTNTYYRCVVSSGPESLTSNFGMLVIVAGPVKPQFTTHPVSDTAKVTTPVSFSALASGNPAPSYQWQKRQGTGAWTNVPGATNTAYSISSVVLSDSGSYRCFASNTEGNDSSNSAFLFVYDTFSITVHPVHDTAILGATAGFSVTATGATTTYQWQKRIGTGGTPANIAGATSAAYSFTAQMTDTNTYYRCVVSSGPESLTSNFGMLVTGIAPNVPNQFSSDTVLAVGKNLTLNGTATGLPAPSLIWYFKHPAASPVQKGTGNTLQLAGLAKADSGSFYFVATNTFGSMSSDSIFANILTPVSVTTDLPPSTNAINGGAANFGITVSGDGQISFQWYRNSGVIPGATAASYTLNPVDSAIHNGNTFFCIVSNRHPGITNPVVGIDTSVVCTLKISNLYNPFRVKVERVDIHNTTQVRMKLWSDVSIANFPSTINPVLPWADSVWVMYKTGGYATDQSQAKVQRFSINDIKSAAPDSVKPVVTVGALPMPVDSFYWFNYSVLWHAAAKPDTLLKPYVNSDKVLMLDTASPPNPLVVTGVYKMKTDTALLIIDNINGLNAGLDSLVIIQCSKYQNFNLLILNDTLKVPQLMASGNKDTIVMAPIGTLPLEKDTVYCRWRIQAKNTVLSRLLEMNFPIGWDRPEYTGALDAQATPFGDRIFLFWTAQPADSVRIWWNKAPIPLIHNPSLPLSQAFYPSPQTTIRDTVRNLANKTLYYFGLQIKKDDLWSKITVLSSDTATTAAGDTTMPPNRIKIDSTRFDPERNSMVLLWHINLAAMPTGQSYQCGVTHTLDASIDTADKPIVFVPITQNLNSTEVILYPEITFDTSYTAGLWIRGLGPLGSTPAAKPADSSTARIAIPSFTWQEVNIFPVSDIVYAANKKIIMKKIGGFTHLDTARAYDPGSLPQGFSAVGGITFRFAQKNPANVQPFMLGLKYGALPSGITEKDLGIYQVKDGQMFVFHGFTIQDSVVWTQITAADFAWPFAVLADVQKPVIEVRSPYDTVSPGATVPVYFAVKDNVANASWTFRYGRGDTAYAYNKTTYLSTSNDTTTRIDFIGNSAISPLYGVRAIIVAHDGVRGDSVNVSKSVRDRDGEHFAIPAMQWVPLRSAGGLDNPSLEDIFDRSVPRPDPWQYDIYGCRLYRWYNTAGHGPNAWVEYADSVQDVFDFTPGNLVWCKMADSQVVSFGPGATTNLKQAYEIELKSGEWTDLSLPYRFPVHLRDVLEATSPYCDSLVVCRWVKDSNSYAGEYLFVYSVDTVSAVTDTMVSGQMEDGYTVYNHYTRPVTLKIPPVCLPLSRYGKEAGGPAAVRRAETWVVNMRWREAGAGGYFKRIILGCRKGAGGDIFGPLPPTMAGIQAGVHDIHAKRICGWSLKTGADKNGGYIYDIGISNSTKNTATIEYYLENTGTLPAGMKARIFDLHGAEYAVSGSNKPSTLRVPGGGLTKYMLAIGTDDYFSHTLGGFFMPFKLIKAYPNPFRGALHISYRVPLGIKQVEFYLYTMQGKLLRKGIIRTGTDAGSHVYTMETGNSAVRAGIYILRLTAKDSAGRKVQGGEKLVTCIR